MCGRTICNLNPDMVQSNCQFSNKNRVRCLPKNRYASGKQKFHQSYNISPSQMTPILFCEKDSHTEKGFIDNRIIQPMRWGLIPSWCKDSQNFKFSTHNAKIETILEKNMYKSGLKKGNRCIAIIEGFYEWKGKSKSQPYLLKPKVSESVLNIAGVYDIVDSGNDKLYSYTIITEEAQGQVASIHHRCPVILHNDEEIELWLDSENVSPESAIKYLESRPWVDDDLDIYPVSTIVNNSSNNDPKCIVKIELTENSQKSTVLTRWLNSKPDDVNEPDEKKVKLEDKPIKLEGKDSDC